MKLPSRSMISVLMCLVLSGLGTRRRERTFAKHFPGTHGADHFVGLTDMLRQRNSLEAFSVFSLRVLKPMLCGKQVGLRGEWIW